MGTIFDWLTVLRLSSVDVWVPDRVNTLDQDAILDWLAFAVLLEVDQDPVLTCTS